MLAVEEMEGVVDDVKLVAEELDEGADDSGMILPCAALLAAVPLLQSCDITLKASDGQLKLEVFHRELMRRFKAHVDADGLAIVGFNSRDTLDDCLAILRECLRVTEDGRTKRTVTVAPMKKTGASGFDGESACASGLIACDFAECTTLRVKFTEDLGRDRPYDYLLDLAELKMEPMARSELMTQALRDTVREQRAQIESLCDTVKAQSEAHNVEIGSLKRELKKKADKRTPVVVMYRSTEMGEDYFHKWTEMLAPTVEGIYSLRGDKCNVRVGVTGLYRISARVLFGSTDHCRRASATCVGRQRDCDNERRGSNRGRRLGQSVQRRVQFQDRLFEHFAD